LNSWLEKGDALAAKTIPSEMPKILLTTLKQPLGVVAGNSSVEFPRVDSRLEIAPALISGNTVIFKPATLTPFTGARVIQVFEQAGIPAGVLNMIVGSGSR